MNPSVEEAEDESKFNASDFHPENGRLSWSKISSRHESMLSSHLEMLHSARNVARDDDNMLQIISSMLEKTNRLVSQFNVVKKQIKNGELVKIQTSPRDSTCNILFVRSGDKTRESTTPGDAKSATPIPGHSTGKKRTRPEKEAINMTTDGAQQNLSQKRKRLDLILSGKNEDAQNLTPESIETEDISEEVQRRLEIKEEQRKKRGTSMSEKRKRNRDSLASNDSASSSFGSTSRPKKRRRELGSAKMD